MTTTTIIVNMTQQDFNNTFVTVITIAVFFGIVLAVVNFLIKD